MASLGHHKPSQQPAAPKYCESVTEETLSMSDGKQLALTHGSLVTFLTSSSN